MNYYDLSKTKRFTIGNGFEVVSQDPGALVRPDASSVVNVLLPVFIAVWRATEDVTGHRWHCTSYIRQSPSHSQGESFDLAPEIEPRFKSQYGVFANSDPVLYKRIPLILALRELNNHPIAEEIRNMGISIGMFIESDHIHIQALRFERASQTFAVVKWGLKKYIYPDTERRALLPFTDSAY